MNLEQQHDRDQRIEIGAHELCDLAQHMGIEEAEGFFQDVAYRASNRFRRISKEKGAE